MTANDLRLALIVIGLFILAGIYFYSRWRSRKQVNDIFAPSHRDAPDVLLDGQGASQKTEPVFSGKEQAGPEGKIEPEITATAAVEEAGSMEPENTLPAKEEPVAEATTETPEKAEKPVTELPKRLKLVVMHLMPKDGKTFKGAAVLKALQVHKLRFGEMDIFHRITAIDDKDVSVFSVANMVKPGTLIPDELEKAELPGISFFLKLPAPIDSLKAYDDMLHCVQHMATTLNADIKDEEFMTLSREKIALQRAQLF